jgi:cyclopropane-fatty-acyl-phospholipid synthase
VFQIQLTKRSDAVPLTRDYMALPPVGTGSADRAAYPRLVR